jgi:tetratricopeptide (TPR) repeat protein
VLPPNARFCLICGTALTTSVSSVVPAPVPPASPPPTLPTAFANGRYQVKRFLGEGGKKKVYLVHDTQLDRDVAFSLIKTQGLDDVGVERIKREARLMGRLGDHPHIVSLYDIGEEAGQPFLVSQLMAGGDVEGLIERAPEHRPPLAQTLRIADQVCQALAYAHEHGIIHRDLKPGNVWLTKDGTAKLGDFGLAMAVDKTRLSVAGMIVGTVGYLPPEQALGKTPEARSDLYSLGAMLYEMVTGRPPFLGDDPVAIISQHLNTQPVAPSWHDPAVPKPLEALILRLLAKDPTERLPSAGVVQEQLAALAMTLATTLTPATGDLAPPASANPLDRLAGGVFVGREGELAALRAGVDAALGGQAQVLLVVGEPGIGKTRLAEEVATYAALRGLQTLWGRNYEWEGAPAYWPWVQVIRGYVHERDTEGLRSDLGPGAPDIAQVVSEIRERLPGLPDLPHLEPEQARFRLFDSVTTFVKHASRRQPLLLVLDDLHWADKPSLLLLEFLARELGTARVLVLGTYRDVEVGRQHPLAQTLAELSRSRLSRRILVRGLPREDVARFITLTAGTDPSPDLVAAVHQETEGNPFFVSEVVRLLVAEGRLERSPAARTWSVSIPESVREVVGRRLSRLSDDCNRVLAIGSVIGREFRLATLELVTNRPTDELLELLEEAVRARVLHEQDALGHYRFSHALVQETLYGEQSTARRVRLHGQVAAAIERLQAANPTPYFGELAQHYFHAASAGYGDKAIEYGIKAAERAMEQLAWEAAIEHYQRALQVFDLQQPGDDRQRCELLLTLGEAQTRAGTTDLAMETYLRAAQLAHQLGDEELLARATLASDDASLSPMYLDATWIGLLEAALVGLSPGDSVLRVKVQSRLAVGLSDEPAMRERREVLANDAVAMARRLGDQSALAYTLLARQIACWTPDSLAERLADSAEILSLCYEVKDWQMALWAHHWRADTLLEIGDVQGSDAEIDRFAPLAQELHQLRDLAFLSWWGALRATMVGHFAESERLVQQVLALAPDWSVEVTGRLFSLRKAQGRLGEVEPAIAEFAARSPLLAWQCALAVLYSEVGREADAQALLDQLAAEDFASLQRDRLWLANMAYLAQTCAALRATQHAATLYPLLLPYADRCAAATGFHGSVSHHLGLLATTLSDWDAAAKHFDDALAMHVRVGALPFVANTQHAYADMLVRRGQPTDQQRALELVDAARSTAEDLGMTRLSEQALALKVRVQGILKA